MKKIQLFFALIIIANLLFAKNINECRKVVSITAESINSGSLTKLQSHFSDDFTISGQQGEIAKIVLNQIISQLNDSVISFAETGIVDEDSILILNYNFNYNRLGEKEAKFIFNEQNQIIELSLFRMKIKRLKSETELQQPKDKCISVSFEKHRNLIFVDGKYNGETYKFMLDSGAPKLIINSPIKSISSTISSSRDVNGNISNMDIEKIDNFSFAGVELKNQDALVMDFSHLEKEIGIEIKGLIGYEIIKERDILFDYKNNLVHFLDPDFSEEYINENFKNHTYSSFHFTLNKHIPVLMAKIGKKNYYLGIDCGAEANLMDENLYDDLKKYSKDLSEDTLTGIENVSKIVKRSKLKKVKFDNETFKNMSTVFSDITHLSEKLQIHGILGYEFLSKQPTLISFKRREILLIKG